MPGTQYSSVSMAKEQMLILSWLQKCRPLWGLQMISSLRDRIDGPMHVSTALRVKAI